MIQRIQSLYLLLVAILMAILCFLPFAEFLKDTEVYEQTVWGIRTVGENPEYVLNTTPMAILTILSALLPLVTIFLYKWRLLQMRMCIVEMVLLIGLLAYMIMFLVRTGGDFSDKIVFSIVDLFPLVSLVFAFLAFRGIYKDIVLVKSLDRIR